MNLSQPTVDALRKYRAILIDGIDGISEQERQIGNAELRLEEMREKLSATRDEVNAIDRDLRNFVGEVSA